MIPITPRTAPQFLGAEFNRFLFAPVGTDRYGGQLSVVSALARLDLDAWAEAASLARLPRDVAAEKLSARLRKFTEIPMIRQDSNIVAARLIALLPKNSDPAGQLAALPTGWRTASGATILAILLALGLALGLQYGHLALHSGVGQASAASPTMQAPGPVPAPVRP